MSAERTLPATPRRREQAHRRGLLPTNEGLAWLASAAMLTALLPLWLQSVTVSFSRYLSRLPFDASSPDAALSPLVARLSWQVVWPTVMLLAATTATGLSVKLFLDRPRLVFDRLAAFERLHPAHGLQRIFSRETVRQLLTSLVALVLLMLTLWWTFSGVWEHVQQGSLEPTEDGQSGLWLAWRALWGTLLAAGVILAMQQVLRWRASEQRLRMTAAEFRDEQRLMEADRRVRLPTDDVPEDSRSPLKGQPPRS